MKTNDFSAPRDDASRKAPGSSLGAVVRDERRRFNAFVARHELAWDLTLAVLALVYLLIGFVEDHRLVTLDEGSLALIELAITLVFLLEFVVRLYAAKSRRAYLKHHWIDLLALLPSIRALRFLRLGRVVYLLQAARILRLGALVRFLAEINRVTDDISGVAKRNGVHIFFVLAAAVVLFGGVLLWEIESPTNPAFHNIGDALWWAFATMSTVGYGNGPTTTPGRAVAALIMVVGIACFGVLTATVTAHFARRTPAHDVSMRDVMETLQDIRERLDRLERRAPPTPAADGDGASAESSSRAHDAGVEATAAGG